MFDPASLKYDANGLIPAIAQDHRSGEVLMMAWMNAQSLRRTLDSGRVTYWSRSRQTFWAKGETSGHVQKLVEQIGPACHTNRRSCFYSALRDDAEVEIMQPLEP